MARRLDAEKKRFQQLLQSHDDMDKEEEACWDDRHKQIEALEQALEEREERMALPDPRLAAVERSLRRRSKRLQNLAR